MANIMKAEIAATFVKGDIFCRVPGTTESEGFGDAAAFGFVSFHTRDALTFELYTLLVLTH